MRVGSYTLATEQGLGYLAKSFYDHGFINTVAVHPHSSRTNHYEWYPNRVSKDELLNCDAIIFFETAFDWKLIPKARERGVKTILMPMYECTNYPLPYEPSHIVCPSLLDKDFFEDSIFLPVPVDVPWKLRRKAEVFVHNSGNGGLGGRNGTKEVLEAMQYVKSPIKLIVRSQVEFGSNFRALCGHDERIETRIGTFDDIWSEGDVFLFPEKFNGLSLPLQEAFASGMLVMAGDRYPMNTWLPTEPLIPVQRYVNESIAREFKSAVYDPQTIAKQIDLWYGADIEDYSRQGKEWASEHSFQKLLPNYQKLI